jgi:SAM-dependent methyltransferase
MARQLPQWLISGLLLSFLFVGSHLILLLRGASTCIPHTADSSQCRDSCVNGICVVNKCFCDIGFTNPTLEGCSERSKPQFECSLEPLEDRCMEYEEFGRLTAFSPERVKLSSECEVNFWKNVEVPHRNEAQLIFMRYFKDLPKHLGHVLELGSGPYTKLRLLLQEGQVTRTMEDILSVTLEDPLLLRYIQEAKSTSLNDAGQLCLEATPSWDPRVIDQVSGEKIDHSCIPTLIANFGAEHAFPEQTYDTVIMMNVIEHALDARKILDNLYHSIKRGGYLIFAEEFVHDVADSDACHPLKLRQAFFREFLELNFETLFVDADLAEWQELPNVVEGARRSVYSIAKKP